MIFAHAYTSQGSSEAALIVINRVDRRFSEAPTAQMLMVQINRSRKEVPHSRRRKQRSRHQARSRRLQEQQPKQTCRT